MSEKLIVAGVVLLILIVIIYMLHDSDLVREARKMAESAANKRDEAKEKGEVEIADAPVIKIKEPGEKKYHEKKMDRRECKIGRGDKNQIVLNDKKVEETHAKIEKKLIKERICYTMTNFSKINPVELYNRTKDQYEYLGYKEEVELDEKTVFYIGDTKILIILNQKKHTPSKTEWVVNEPESSSKAQSSEEKSGMKYGSDTKKTSKASAKQHTDRSERVRVVTRNELDI